VSFPARDAVPGAAGTPHPPAVTVVMPIRNEARHIEAAVSAVLRQHYAGRLDVVLAVAPSQDGTEDVVARLADRDPRVTVVPNPRGTTPAGLNAALAAVTGDVVVRLDGHAEPDRDYVTCAVDVLERTGAANVGGIMAAEGRTPFEQAVATAMRSRFGVGGAAFHVGGDEGPADTVYLGVFRRDALRAVGGFDETYLRAQDWELNYRLRRAGHTVWFSPRLKVTYRPRSSVRALASQYYHYGRWRRVLMRRHPDTVNLRYLAPPATLVGVGLGVVGSVAGIRPARLLPAAYLVLVAAGAGLTGRRLPGRALLWLPAVYATMHLSWGAGFLASPRSLATSTTATRHPVPRPAEAT
jgi:GT2 family glycosyltransferase